MFDPRISYYGFISWNNDWKDSFAKENVGGNLHPLDNVHLYYEKWVLRSKSEDFSMFQNLWEIVMIRSCSEAACESCVSLMGQLGGKKWHLEPENFSKEMVLRVNLGPLHILAEGLVNEFFKFDKGKSYLRKESRLSHLVSKDFDKSAAVSTFEKRVKKSHIFLLISGFLIKISRFNCILWTYSFGVSVL